MQEHKQFFSYCHKAIGEIWISEAMHVTLNFGDMNSAGCTYTGLGRHL